MKLIGDNKQPHIITIPIVDALQIANAYSSDINHVYFLNSHCFKFFDTPEEQLEPFPS